MGVALPTVRVTAPPVVATVAVAPGNQRAAIHHGRGRERAGAAARAVSGQRIAARPQIRRQGQVNGVVVQRERAGDGQRGSVR